MQFELAFLFFCTWLETIMKALFVFILTKCGRFTVVIRSKPMNIIIIVLSMVPQTLEGRDVRVR